MVQGTVKCTILRQDFDTSRGILNHPLQRKALLLVVEENIIWQTSANSRKHSVTIVKKLETMERRPWRGDHREETEETEDSYSLFTLQQARSKHIWPGCGCGQL